VPPVTAGAKLTLMVQWAPGTRLAPQSLLWLKFPPATMLAIVMLTLLALLSVMARGALVVPTPWDPKASDDGDNALKGVLSKTLTSGDGVTNPVEAITSGNPS